MVKATAITAGERLRPARTTMGVSTICALVLLLFLALPASAAVDPLDSDPPEPSPESTVSAENPEAISTLVATLRSETTNQEAGEPRQATTPALDIVFPLAEAGSYTASFGAPRDGGSRKHQGIDIFAEKLTPVVAAADGIVILMRDTIGGDCCVLRLRHQDGSETLYLHLNNDSPGTDDGMGYGIAEGIALGASVRAGQVIGYVGDSGNAEETPSHLHFEYHEPSGAAIDPYVSLRVSQGADAIVHTTLQEIPTELAFTGVSTLFLVAIGFAMVIIGVLLISFSKCEDLWET